MAWFLRATHWRRWPASKILQEGGNAVDAVLAAAFVLAVVKPETSGPGGDLFALVSMKKTGKVEALNSSGPAPAKATIDYFHGAD